MINIGATFDRSKTFVAGETLTAVDLNAVETNLLTNFTPAGMDDYSVDAATMRIVTDPYPASVESLATSTQGELERIRYLIKQLSNQAQWYIDPVTTAAGFALIAAADAAAQREMIDVPGRNVDNIFKGYQAFKGNLSVALTGTVAVTNLATGVVGTGTLFTTELAVGDSIKIGTEIFTVSVITDALNITLDSAYQGATASGLTAYRDPTFFTIENGDAVNKLTITRSGNVGIGTTGPGYALHVAGGTGTDIRVEGSTNPRFSYNQTAGGTDQKRWQNYALTNTLKFTALNDAETVETAWLTVNRGTGTAISSIVFPSTGNVGIGKAPLYQLELSTDSAGKPTTSTWIIVSDKRLKENIILANLDRCYEIVKQVPLKHYKWRDDVYSYEQAKDRSMLGWMADDVKIVFPKAVDVKRFESGDVIIDDCLDLNADQMLKVMYGTIQKLIQKIEKLEERVK